MEVSRRKKSRRILSPVPDVELPKRTKPDRFIDSPWNPRVLVMGPGGIKGLKILGFLCVMEDEGVLEKLDTYCGVSIGAVIALLLVCGYKIREIVEEAVNMDIFRESGMSDIATMMKHQGFMSNEPARKTLSQLVMRKCGTVPTLRGLYMMTGSSLSVITLNATDEICVTLSPFSHPNVSCVDAVMFSMNIPFVFYQLVHNGKTYVDGALGNPYPVDYFDDGNTEILGIYIRNRNNISRQPTQAGPRDELLSISSYFSRIMYSLVDHRRNSIIQQCSNKCKHVCLETTFADSLGYSITLDDKATLIVEGYNQGKEFIKRVTNDTYVGPSIPKKQKYVYPEYLVEKESSSSSSESCETGDTDSDMEMLSELAKGA